MITARVRPLAVLTVAVRSLYTTFPGPSWARSSVAGSEIGTAA